MEAGSAGGDFARDDRTRVLHVDDEPSILEETAAFLDSELDDPHVESVTSPDVALEERSYECIVSDYDMPGMDGLAFFEAVRDVDPEVPFILYTGKGSEEVASRALNAGVTGYFRKGDPTSSADWRTASNWRSRSTGRGSTRTDTRRCCAPSGTPSTSSTGRVASRSSTSRSSS